MKIYNLEGVPVIQPRDMGIGLIYRGRGTWEKFTDLETLFRNGQVIDESELEKMMDEIDGTLENAEEGFQFLEEGDDELTNEEKEQIIDDLRDRLSGITVEPDEVDANPDTEGSPAEDSAPDVSATPTTFDLTPAIEGLRQRMKDLPNTLSQQKPIHGFAFGLDEFGGGQPETVVFPLPRLAPGDIGSVELYRVPYNRVTNADEEDRFVEVRIQYKHAPNQNYRVRMVGRTWNILYCAEELYLLPWQETIAFMEQIQAGTVPENYIEENSYGPVRLKRGRDAQMRLEMLDEETYLNRVQPRFEQLMEEYDEGTAHALITPYDIRVEYDELSVNPQDWPFKVYFALPYPLEVLREARENDELEEEIKVVYRSCKNGFMANMSR